MINMNSLILYNLHQSSKLHLVNFSTCCNFKITCIFCCFPEMFCLNIYHSQIQYLIMDHKFSTREFNGKVHLFILFFKHFVARGAVVGFVECEEASWLCSIRLQTYLVQERTICLSLTKDHYLGGGGGIFFNCVQY